MSVLVTGGAGFIGSNLVDALLARGYSVAVVDDLSTGRKENLNKKAKFYRQSIIGEGIKNIIKDNDIELVFHLAAQVQVRKSLEDPLFDAQVNIIGSLNLLRCCKNVEKFIYASSGGAIYGEPRYLPVDERHAIVPLSPYGASKYIVEEYLRIYGSLHSLPWLSLRYANVYGERQDPYGEAGVVAIFASKMLRKEQPIINGDGEQTRDFVHVSDVVRANLLGIKKGRNEAFNIGTGKETSVNEVFETIKKLLGSNVKPKHGPEIPGEVRRIFLDARKAKKKLGWRAEVGLEEGIGRLLEYLKINR